MKLSDAGWWNRPVAATPAAGLRPPEQEGACGGRSAGRAAGTAPSQAGSGGRRARCTLGGVALLVAILAGLGGVARAATGDGDRGKAPVAASPDRPVSSVAAPDDVQAAETYLRERFADRFGGLYMDDAGNGQAVVVVVLTQPLGAEGEEALRDRLSGQPVRFVEGEYTLAELERVQQTVTENTTRLLEQGIGVIWSGVDVRTNRVTLGVAGSLEAARAAVQDLPRADAIMVVAAQPVHLLGAEGGPAGTVAPSAGVSTVDAAAGREPASSEGGPRAWATRWWAALLAALSRWWAALAGPLQSSTCAGWDDHSC